MRKEYKIIHGQRVLVTICPPAVVGPGIDQGTLRPVGGKIILDYGCYRKARSKSIKEPKPFTVKSDGSY